MITLMVAMLGTAVASAQTVTITGTTIGHPGVSQSAPGRSQVGESYISYSDCATPNTWVAYFNLSSSSNAVDVWATEGGDCTSVANRQASSAGSSDNCYQIATDQPTNTGTVNLTAQQLVRAISTVPAGTCHDPDTSGTAHTLTLYFVATGTTTDPWATTEYATYTGTEILLVGPPLLSGYDLAAGDGYLVVSLAADTNPNLQGYYVYCSPTIGDAGGGCVGDAGCVEADAGSAKLDAGGAVSSSSGAGDAGSGGGGSDAGSDDLGGAGGASADAGTTADAGGSAAACNVDIAGLTPGVSPPASAPVCAVVNADVTSHYIPNALNGTRYVVGIAAFDIVGNIGPLSGSLCQTPDATDTFFGEYCRDKGSDCSGCAQSSVGREGAGSSLALGMLVLGAVLVMTRARRKRTSVG